MTIFDLINEWFVITDYKKDNTSISLQFHYDYELTAYDIEKRNQFIEKIIDEYKSEELVCCLLKDIVDRYLESTMISLKDLLESDHSIFMNFYKDYKTYNVDSKIKKLSDLLSSFYKNKNLIGEITSNDISKCISEVIEVFDKLKFYVLKSSSLPIQITNLKYSDELYVYNSLAECSIAMCNFVDGIYLAYIQNGEFSSDGFFTFIMKSNGNIISLNDQLRETYIGQHGVKRQRNANYTQEKSWLIFPYSLFDLDESKKDSKGNPLEYNLKFEDIKIDELNLDDSQRIYMCMVLMSYKYNNLIFECKNVSYSTKFIADNKLSDCKNLVKSDLSLSLVNDYTKFINTLKENKNKEEICSFNFGENGIIYESTAEEFSYYAKILFNEWFDESMYKSDCKELINPNEFVGSIDEMNKQLVFRTRCDIVESIRKKMIDYLVEKDYGREEIKEYRNMLKTRKDIIYKNLMDDEFIKNHNCVRIRNGEKSHYYESCINDKSNFYVLNIEMLSKSKNCNFQDEYGECNTQLYFDPNSCLDICDLLEIEMKDLPKTIRGWTYESNRSCVNSILNLYNPFETIQNPYKYIQYNEESLWGKRPLYEKWQYENNIDIWYPISNPFKFFIFLSKRKYNHMKNKR